MTWKHDMPLASRPGQRYGRIFSGKDSKGFWRCINKVGKRKKKLDNEALIAVIYSLAGACQELEQVVRSLESRVAKLEDD